MLPPVPCATQAGFSSGDKKFIGVHQSPGISLSLLVMYGIVRLPLDSLDGDCAHGRLAVSRAVRAGSAPV